jgi:hypothetical protein
MLNWNGWADTIECLESVFQMDYDNFDVVLLDNGSNDDSIDRILEYCRGDLEPESAVLDYCPASKPISVILCDQSGPEEERSWMPSDSKPRLILIRSRENLGFAEGNNLGIQFALNWLSPRYVFLLNNDTVVDKGTLRLLVDVFDSVPNVGLVGPKICYYSDPSRIWAAGGRTDFWLGRIGNVGEGKNQTVFKGRHLVDYVSGCALLIRRDLLDSIGHFAPEYFSYFEDSDLGVRAQRAGFVSVVQLDACILHKSGSSIRMTDRLDVYYFTRNKLLFMKRNGPWYCYPTFVVSFLAVYGSIAVMNLLRGNILVGARIFSAVRDFIGGRFGKVE